MIYSWVWTLLHDLSLDFDIVSGKMIKLFKVKEKQRELAENANGKTRGKKQSAGELRLHKGSTFHVMICDD